MGNTMPRFTLSTRDQVGDDVIAVFADTSPSEYDQACLISHVSSPHILRSKCSAFKELPDSLPMDQKVASAQHTWQATSLTCLR